MIPPSPLRPSADLSRANFRPRAIQFALAAICLALACCSAIRAQDSQSPQPTEAWSVRVANSTIQRWPDGRFVPAGAPWAWDHAMSVLLQGVTAVWRTTNNPDDLAYVQRSLDQFLSADGSSIRTYNPLNYSVDDVLLGRQLLFLYATTHDEKYRRAAALVRQQLALQPRTPEGGFWHIGRRPQQVSLDNLYMLEPFYAEYARTFHEPKDFDDITHQFVLTESHLRDPKTGLLYPSWDEALDQPWADKTTGASPVFWSRSMGWAMLALVETIPYYPAADPGRAKLLAILDRLAAAIVKFQDPATGLWYQVTDQPNGKDNFFESASSCMFAYSLAKAVRLGYLPAHYFDNASRAYQGVLKQFVHVDGTGAITISGTAGGSDLTSNQTRDNAYAYYVAARPTDNAPRTFGLFMMASVEMESAPPSARIAAKTAQSAQHE
jgi:unsaturated rhamnogalacturonyl hydrolase